MSKRRQDEIVLDAPGGLEESQAAFKQQDIDMLDWIEGELYEPDDPDAEWMSDDKDDSDIDNAFEEGEARALEDLRKAELGQRQAE